jgi:hypothetical protein
MTLKSSNVETKSAFLVMGTNGLASSTSTHEAHALNGNLDKRDEWGLTLVAIRHRARTFHVALACGLRIIATTNCDLSPTMRTSIDHNMAAIDNGLDLTGLEVEDRILFAMATLNRQRTQLGDMATERPNCNDVNATRCIQQAKDAIDACMNVGVP